MSMHHAIRRTLLLLTCGPAAAAILLAGSAPAEAASEPPGGPTITAIDLNGDGSPDAVAADLDGDGFYDTYALAAGRLLAIGQDRDEDGVLDLVAVDSDGDGVLDLVSVDSDEDGVPDAVYTDPTGSGSWEPASGQPAAQPDPDVVSFTDLPIDVSTEQNPLITFLQQNPGAIDDPTIAALFDSVAAADTAVDLTNALPSGWVAVPGADTDGWW